MSSTLRILLFITTFLKIQFINTDKIKLSQKINIYCSNEFYFANRLNRLCRWNYDNGTSHADSYNSALLDCPNGYILGTYGDINGTQLKFDCVYSQKIWINGNSTNNNNVLNLITNGSLFTSREIETTKIEYFLCLNKTQRVKCKPDQYLDSYSLLCINTLTYNETCTFNEMCNQALNLTCNLSNELCDCQSTHYWNGNSCSKLS
jgi:hypothetical protein